MPSDTRWSMHGSEPDLYDILSDPIVELVMRRDGIASSDVWAAISRARLRLHRLPAVNIESATWPRNAERRSTPRGR